MNITGGGRVFFISVPETDVACGIAAGSAAGGGEVQLAVGADAQLVHSLFLRSCV